MKKVFTDHLPRKEGFGANKGKLLIDWKNSIGYTIKFIYDDIEGIIEIKDYNSKDNKLSLNYLNTIGFKMATCHFLNCKLKELLGLKTVKYKYNVGDIVKNKTSEIKILEQIRIATNSKSKPNRTDKGYKYECLNCDNIDKILESHLKEGKGCNLCCLSPQKVIKGINDIATTHPHLVKYFVNIEDTYIYSIGSNVSVNIICNECGNIKTIRLYDLYRYGVCCPKCSDGQSYPNKFCFSLLEQLNIEFGTEYNPDWCKFLFNNEIRKGRFDFYFEINNKKYIIEMDGGWHNKDNNMSGRTKEESQFIDDEKDRLANEHGIEIIRIDCKISDLDYIKKNILSSKLKKLFDLNETTISWLKCHQYACNSLVKIACDLWNSGVKNTVEIGKVIKTSYSAVLTYLNQGSKLNWCVYKTATERKFEKIQKSCELWNNGIKSTTDIGKLLNIHGNIAYQYLKEGAKLNLCDYTPEKARHFEAIKRTKSVICLENGFIFQSVKEIEEKSLELFNTKLRSDTVGKVCTGKFKQYKGYHFKYIN